MKCYCIPKFEKDIRKLERWCPSIRKDLYYIKNLLEKDYPLPNEAIPSSRAGTKEIFKTRMVCSALSFGKSKGPRLIYKQEENKSRVIFFLLYTHTQSKYKRDIYALNEVRQRARDFTEESLTEI